jgi:hypothetical protein
MNEYGIPFTGVEAGEGFMPPGAFPGFVFTDPREFLKAVTSGYGTDVAGFTGGRALQLQSIEDSLLATIPLDDMFTLFNLIDQSPATATVDEFVKQTDIGGWPGAGFNDELGDIVETTGTYGRQVVLMKYLMNRRRVSAVQASTKGLVDAIAREKLNGARSLKVDAEYGIIYGNAAINPFEFDGLVTQIRAHGDGDLMIDVRGGGLSYVAEEIQNLAAVIRSRGHFGRLTDYICSPAVQTSEINQKLDPAFRVSANPSAGLRSLEVGTVVSGINVQSNGGTVRAHEDIFIEEGGMPWEARTGAYPGLVAGSGLPVPVIASAVAGAGGASSQFTLAMSGLYYYGVEARGKAGRSTTAVSAQVTVAQGDKVTITITNPGSIEVTGYVIYRGRRNGTNAKTDLREMIQVARQAGASTVFEDLNAFIPGTSILLGLNLTPGDKAVTFRRLLPMTMFPLFPTAKAEHPWAQMMFGGLRVGKVEHIGMAFNICPKSQAWRPF